MNVLRNVTQVGQVGLTVRLDNRGSQRQQIHQRGDKSSQVMWKHVLAAVKAISCSDPRQGKKYSRGKKQLWKEEEEKLWNTI